jgi:hypothetical protein
VNAFAVPFFLPKPRPSKSAALHATETSLNNVVQINDFLSGKTQHIQR